MRCPRAGAGCPDLVDAHVEEFAAVMAGPAAVVAAPDRRTGACREQDALGAGLERDLACLLTLAFPQRDNGRRIEPGWPGTLRHAERCQRQDGRAGVIGQDAGIPGGPPGPELGPVEEGS